MAGQAKDLGVLAKAGSPLQTDASQKGGGYGVPLKSLSTSGEFEVYVGQVVAPMQLYAWVGPLAPMHVKIGTPVYK